MSTEKLGRLVRDLMNKGFPGPWNTMKEQIACAKFLRALGDAKMHCQVMTSFPPPQTLDRAIEMACQLEQYSTGDVTDVRRRGGSRGYTEYRSSGRRERQFVRAAATESVPMLSNSESGAELRRRIEVLGAELAKSRIQAPADVNRTSVRDGQPSTDMQATSSRRRPPFARPGGPQHRRICYACQQPGYMAKDCPQVKTTSSGGTTGTQTASARHTALSPAATSRPLDAHHRVYLYIRYKGKRYRALLDSGCDVCLLSADLLPELG
jgi:hypothetical protein